MAQYLQPSGSRMSVTASTFTKAAAPKSSDIIATKIFIDSVPEYYQLQTCAEPQVSAIVRAMASGCGDNSRMTSYACFCYSSSSKYDYLISAQVSTACNDQAQASSAQDVFGKYCQMGATRGITPAGKYSVHSRKSICNMIADDYR
jgi:hypothetical protein